MSENEAVTIERDGDIAIVSFNRPDQLNAIDGSVRRGLLAAAGEVNDDESVKVVILAGNGRAFCAGADLTEVQQDEVSIVSMFELEYKPPLMAISNAPKPWVSAVNGAAAGIGSAFAMVCDMTVMAEDAYLYQAFAAISLVPDGGATWHLARTVGRKRAFELMALGEKLPAARCLEWGLCNRVVAAGELDAAARELARELAGKAPLSLRYTKQSLNAAMEYPLDQVIDNEARLQELCIKSEDAKEGATAFLEKRAPQFKGR